jgi:hypothetical protein
MNNTGAAPLRKRPALTGRVVNREGAVEIHPVSVHRDLIRLNGYRPYTGSAGLSSAHEPRSAMDDDAHVLVDLTPSPSRPTPAALESRLGALRAEIEALGGTFEPVWGFRHLSGEIDRLHAEKEIAS